MDLSKLLVSFGVFLAIFLTSGCGSSSANIRLIDALPTQSNLDLLVDGKSVATSVGYGAASSYISVSSGSRHIQAEGSGTTNVVLDLSQSLGSNSYSTALAAATGSIVLTDSHTAPSSGNFSIRAVNASGNLQSADVYILPSGTDINSVTPTYSGLTLQSNPTYTNLTPGTYQVVFTLPGQKVAVTSTSSLAFTSGQVRTVIGLDGFGGAAPTTSVISDFN